jgi:hypothetical protein
VDDLSRYPASLAPSSMSPGNTISDDASLAMTAPGSDSINPIPDRLDDLPQPKLGTQRERTVMVHGQGDGFPGTWAGASEAGTGRFQQ